MRLASDRTSILNRAGRAAARAFTLMEIMIVVVILSILAGVTAPVFLGAMGTLQIDAAARDVASAMDFCYNTAIATGRVHAIMFSPDGMSYELLTEIPEEWMEEGDYDPFNPVLDSVDIPGFAYRVLPPGIELSEAEMFEGELAFLEDGSLQILFFPDGSTEFVEMSLTDEEGGERIIKLNGLTGAVQIDDPADLTDDERAAEGIRGVRKRDPEVIG